MKGISDTALIGLNPQLFEAINLVTALLCVAVAFVFVRYLYIEFKTGRLSLFTYVGLRHQMAVAVTFALLGEFGMRAWTWYARFSLNVSIDASWMKSGAWNLVPLAFAGMQCLGLMCLARVFAPDEWRYYSWITFLSIAAVLLLRVVLI